MKKHMHMARRRMSHVIDELYTALFRAGGREVELRLVKEEAGLRLPGSIGQTVSILGGLVVGSAAVEAHVLPNRNGMSPICRMAGMPETIRYTLMSSTHPTVIRPSSRNTPCIIFSKALLLFIKSSPICSLGLSKRTDTSICFDKPRRCLTALVFSG